MNSFSLVTLMRQILGSLGQILLQPLRRWTKPDNYVPIPNAALDLTRSKSELMLENALLRQQLVVLQRQTKRPKLTWRDRALFVLLSSKLRTWKQALLIVQPDTLLRWHRELFRRFWRRKPKSEKKPGRPPLSGDLIALK
jgi:putative transposase